MVTKLSDPIVRDPLHIAWEDLHSVDETRPVSHVLGPLTASTIKANDRVFRPTVISLSTCVVLTRNLYEKVDRTCDNDADQFCGIRDERH